MTLPWAEDSIRQVPVGSPQMNGVNLDVLRAGNRGKDHEILYYMMPHYPGNIPEMWRRLFQNAVGHGMTIVNLFEFHAVWIAYTENHVTSDEMFAMAHLLPKDFDAVARELIHSPLAAAGVVRPVTANAALVETSIIESDEGTIIAVNNRTAQSRKGVQLTVNLPVKAKKIELASGRKVGVQKKDGHTILTFDLDQSDVVILR